MLSTTFKATRGFAILFVALVAAFLLAMVAAPAPAGAHLITAASTDAGHAYAYDRSECGAVSVSWHCADASSPYPTAWKPSGWDHTRTAHGAVLESTGGGSFRYCFIVTHWTHGALSFHWNSCRHPGASIPL